MENLTQKFIGLVFFICFTVNAQDNYNLYFDTFYSEDFESILSTEWNANTGELINYNGTSILGNLAQTSVSCNISNLPLHDSILIEFDLYIFDSWDGQQDPFYVRINDELVLNTTFLNVDWDNYKNQCFPENCPAENPAHSGAYDFYLPQLYSHGDISSLYKLSFVIDNQTENLFVELTSNSDTDVEDESWGIDNFKLTSILVTGCTDSSSLNYNPNATIDNGSCLSLIGYNDSSLFYISSNPLTWEYSNYLSTQLSGHLATITSQEENEAITNLILEYPIHAFWLGAQDMSNSNNFQWETGEEFSYENWNNGEPTNNNVYSEPYLNIWGSNALEHELLGTWNDYDNDGWTGESHTHALIEIPTIYGCSDENAFNFNIEANMDVGSCYPIINGCIDETAYNFEIPVGDVQVDVNTDDGSCYPVINGCLNPIADNYIPSVGDVQIDPNTDDGSCLFSSQVFENLTVVNANLEQALSVFETVEEEHDYSMTFDGDDDYINVPTSNSIDDLSNELSISAWIYPTNYSSNGSHPRIIHRTEQSGGTSERWFLTWCPNTSGWNAEIQFGIGNGSDVGGLTTTTSIPLNEWTYVSVSFNNGSVSLLVNGQTEFQGVSPYSSVEHVQGVDVRIASALNNSYFPGKINCLELWNKALTQEEIQSYMSCTPTGEEDGLVGYWDFNEGSGNTVYDLSGNENHGFIYGAEYSEDVPESYNGCTDVNALNYDQTALCDNGSCVYGDDEYSTLESDLDNANYTLNNVLDTWQSSIDLTTSTLDEVSLINQTLISFNTVIDLSEGWNMFGYGCPQPMDVSEGLSTYTDIIIITKDNNGNAYMPEFSFNGIGNFSPGYGYQIKITEAIEGFSLCGDYTNTDNTQILDIETDNAQMQNDINCLTGNPEIGDYCYGGIVFYVEEGVEGKYGLVVYDSIFTQGAQYFNDQYNTFSWGCNSQEINGADNLTFGYGYKNTLDIKLDCNDENSISNIILSSNLNDFNDWFIPSLGELSLVTELINDHNEFSELATLYNEDYQTWFWSSSEADVDHAWSMNINSGEQSDHMKNSQGGTHGLIPIRSFGNWIMGCMDSLACNFNPEANMADDSCEDAEEGYDCDGNELQFSLSFDGVDDYVDLGPQISLSDAFTFSMKIKSSQGIGVNTYNPLIYCGDRFTTNNENSDFELYIGNGGLTVVTDRANGGDDNYFTAPFEYSDWLNLTLTFDSGLVSIYFDGALSQEHQFNILSVTSDSYNFYLGTGQWLESSGGILVETFYNGNIDDFMFWNKSLTPDEIASYIICPPDPAASNLVGHWDFNEEPSDVTYYTGPSMNFGELYGPSFSDDVPENNCE